MQLDWARGSLHIETAENYQPTVTYPFFPAISQSCFTRLGTQLTHTLQLGPGVRKS